MRCELKNIFFEHVLELQSNISTEECCSIT